MIERGFLQIDFPTLNGTITQSGFPVGNRNSPFWKSTGTGSVPLTCPNMILQDQSGHRNLRSHRYRRVGPDQGRHARDLVFPFPRARSLMRSRLSMSRVCVAKAHSKLARRFWFLTLIDSDHACLSFIEGLWSVLQFCAKNEWQGSGGRSCEVKEFSDSWIWSGGKLSTWGAKN